MMEASLKSAFHNKATVIDLVSQVNDDSNKEIMIMDLSGVNLIVPDELSRDSEGVYEVPDSQKPGWCGGAGYPYKGHPDCRGR